ncbi:Anaphase-promoting complex subunit 23 [Physocladia obscura]|uniref:Anaphase-promoting complex subunit 23 n=1 Tax=Physocladia obscura TaxID=109957 RepID=A0AAD5SR58_9FUNG|nr:Anaphase-promoting complex subunit 23 [Physocladia obscura]
MAQQLATAGLACNLRGLFSSAAWLCAVAPVKSLPAESTDILDASTLHALALFHTKQFSLAAFTLKKLSSNIASPIAIFLRLYSLLLASDLKEKADEKETDLTSLLNELDSLALEKRDGHAIVCLRLNIKQRAHDLLVESVLAYPLLFCAWQELAATIISFDLLKKTLARLSQSQNPDTQNPCLQYFLFETDKQLSPFDRVQSRFRVFVESVDSNAAVVRVAEASMYYHFQDIPGAIRVYEKIYESNPYLLDGCDEYANALYVVENGPKLGWLAHRCDAIDRFRPESCIAVANYYSIRGEHEKAVGYLRRAVMLDRGSSLAWTLIGHEYLEMKNQVAAIDVYRKAVDINERDFRAWYALGNIYQMLKMPLYALYYFQKATTLKAYDSRFWCGLASCYEDLKNYADAIKCYKRALIVDEAQQQGEGGALIKVARLYEKLKTTALLTDDKKRADAGAAAVLYYQQVFLNRGHGDDDEFNVREAAEYIANNAIKTRNFKSIATVLEYLDTHDDARVLVRECKSLMKIGMLNK